MKRWNYWSFNVIILLIALSMITGFFTGCGDQKSPTEQDSGIPAVLAPQANENDGFVSDEILVKFKPGTPRNEIAAINAKNGATSIEDIPRINVKVLRVPAGKVLEKAQAFSRNPNVEYAEPNHILYLSGFPNDPDFDKQYGLNNIGQTGGTPDADIDAPEAWDTEIGNPGVKIAIVDTGIDNDHEDLASKVVARVNVCRFSQRQTDDDLFGHGTHVAGIAAAITNNGIGVAGVGYNCSLMSVKVQYDHPQGWFFDSDGAKGIIWAADHGANIINMSWGTWGHAREKFMEDAVNYAWDRGCVLVAAAGNSNDSKHPFYPARFDKCIAVAASDSNDNRAVFSNYGDWVDVAAPGVDIYSSFPNHPNWLNDNYGLGLNYGYGSGTSMASPHVAGLAGLLWSKLGSGANNVLVRQLIEDNCDPVGDWVIRGRINADKALGP